MKRTILHIGTTKTGSTSIQKFLSGNRILLAERGVCYPEALGEVSHNKIPAYLQGRLTQSQMQRKHGIRTEQDYAAFEQQLPAALAAEIETASAEQIVISSEHMHSRCAEPEQFARLKDLLAPALEGREVRGVVYLRPQIHHAIALYSTMLRKPPTTDETRHSVAEHHEIDEALNDLAATDMASGACRRCRHLPHRPLS